MMELVVAILGLVLAVGVLIYSIRVERMMSRAERNLKALKESR